jgi:hypothetical protein
MEIRLGRRGALVAFAGAAAHVAGLGSAHAAGPNVLPQANSTLADPGPLPIALEASSEPQHIRRDLRLFLTQPKGGKSYDFVGYYLAISAIEGRQKNVPVGGATISLGLKDDIVAGGQIIVPDDQQSSEWSDFSGTIMGLTSDLNFTPEGPQGWHLDVGVEAGQIEVSSLQLVVFSTDLVYE